MQVLHVFLLDAGVHAATTTTGFTLGNFWGATEGSLAHQKAFLPLPGWRERGWGCSRRWSMGQVPIIKGFTPYFRDFRRVRAGHLLRGATPHFLLVLMAWDGQ